MLFLHVAGAKFVTRATHELNLLWEKKVTAVATSAVAAVLIDDEPTAHLTFTIPIPFTAEST